MNDDALFHKRMPEWWTRAVFAWRGACFGFLAGYPGARWLPAVREGIGFEWLPVVVPTLILCVLPSLPKAWIEQRNRNRAARQGTLMLDIERRREFRS